MDISRNDKLDCQEKPGEVGCRARILGLSKLVECNTNVHVCRWRFSFGAGGICVHPSGLMIAKGIVPSGWALPEAN